METIKLKKEDKILIMGFSGMGKSTLLHYLVEQFANQGHKCLVYDVEKTHTNIMPFNHPKIQVYVPKGGTKEEFNYISKQVFDKGNIIFAVESIDKFCPPQPPLPPEFWKVLHWGREKKIGLIMTSRRPADVHKDICGLVSHYFLFYTYLPNDLKWLKMFIGPTTDRLPLLKPFHFLYWHHGQTKEYKPIGITYG